MGGVSLNINPDHLQHTRHICQNVRIPETPDMPTRTFEIGVTLGIMGRLTMLPTICFNDQPVREAGEISNVRANWNLTTKLYAKHLVLPKMTPQLFLCIGHVCAQGAGKVAFLVLAHGRMVHGQAVFPHPGPPPQAGEGGE